MAKSFTEEPYSLPAKILFVTDLRDLQRCLLVAIRYALAAEAQLRILHILPDIHELFGSRHSNARAALEAVSHSAAGILENAVIVARNAGVHCDYSLQHGTLLETIDKVAEEWNPDRILVGSCNSEGSGPQLLDSMAEAILRESTIPVLIVGPETLVDRCSTWGASIRVLCATLLDREARAVAEYVLRFARIYHAEVTILHVIPNMPSMHPVAARVRKYAQLKFREIFSGVPEEAVQCLIEEGHVEETILRVAQEGGFDLLLVGAVSGASFRTDILPGITYNLVCQSPCPVLVLKKSADLPLGTSAPLPQVMGSLRPS